MIFYDIIPVKHEIKNIWIEVEREIWCPHGVPDPAIKGEFRFFCGCKDLDPVGEIDIPRYSRFFGSFAMFKFRCAFCQQTFSKLVSAKYADVIRKELLSRKRSSDDAN